MACKPSKAGSFGRAAPSSRARFQAAIFHYQPKDNTTPTAGNGRSTGPFPSLLQAEQPCVRLRSLP